jgi:TP901 family phage tail tape measure protein
MGFALSDEHVGLDAKLTIDASQAEKTSSDLSKAIRNLQRQMSDLTSAIDSLTNANERLASTQARASAGAKTAAKDTASASKQAQIYAQYLYDEGKALGYVSNELQKYKSASAAAAKSQNKAGSARVANNLSYIPANTAAPALGSSFGNIEKLTNSNENLIRQRYALYDVATTYGILATSLLAVDAASVKTGADFQSAFTNVQRTVEDGTTSAVLSDIRSNLVDLSTTIPKSFDELAQIATLGNQLGVPADKLEKFTQTVSQFSTVTKISAQDAAQSFGVIGNILGIGYDQYQNLASAIVYVGRTSAATESQIISLTERIGATATRAGFTADQVVGLAGAIASTGVAPERAQGVLETYFNTLNQAVVNGGQELQNFSTITGLTTDQIKKLVDTGGGLEIFGRVLATIGSSKTTNSQTTAALDSLGLAGLRVNEVVPRLAANYDRFTQSLDNSSSSYSKATELAKQNALVTDDLNSRVIEFQGSVSAIVDQLTGGLVPGLADTVGMLRDLTNGLREATNNPVAKNIAGIILGLTTFIGLLAAYKSAAALATASSYALTTAFGTMEASQSLHLIPALGKLGSSLLGISTSAKVAASGEVALSSAAAGSVAPLTASAGAASKLTAALYGIGKATIIIGVIQLVVSLLTDFRGTMISVSDSIYGLVAAAAQGASAVRQFERGIDNILGPIAAANQAVLDWAANFDGAVLNILKGFQGWAKGLPQATTASNDLATSAAVAAGSTGGLASGLTKAGKAAGGAAAKVRTLVDYANDLSTAFGRAFDIRFGSQLAIDQVTSSFQDLTARIRDARNELAKLTADRAVQEYFLSVANAYGDTLRAGEIGATLAEINAKIADTQANATTELKGNSKGAIQNRKTITDLVKQYDDYIASLAASGASQDTLQKAVKQSKSDFLAQAQALGFTTAQLQPYVKSLGDMQKIIAGIPRNITVNANTDPAQQALNEFLAKANTSSGTVTINAKTNKKDLQDAAFASWLAIGIANNQIGKATSSADLKRLHDMFYSGAFGKGYADGGFTGAGATLQPAGVVHKGEYVIPKRDVNQRTGLPYADALGKAQRGSRGQSSFAGGGYADGSAVQRVRLDDYSVKAVAARLSSQIYLDGKVITSTVNSNNALQSVRGAG